MEAIKNINFVSLFDTLVSLLTAFILGGLIGLERQYRQRTAGLRTNLCRQSEAKGSFAPVGASA